jgi:hypothetical protein
MEHYSSLKLYEDFTHAIPWGNSPWYLPYWRLRILEEERIMEDKRERDKHMKGIEKWTTGLRGLF